MKKAVIGLMNIVLGFLTWFLNYVAAYIPVWQIRKFFYKLSGMKIGKRARILLGVYVREPWKIQIGDGSIINEKCVLDGAGGIVIGKNTVISRGGVIYSISHSTSSASFEVIVGKVELGDNCWTGINSVILPGVIFEDGVVLAASSLAVKKGRYKKNMIYSGVPAKVIMERSLSDPYRLNWKPWFR